MVVSDAAAIARKAGRLWAESEETDQRLAQASETEDGLFSLMRLRDAQLSEGMRKTAAQAALVAIALQLTGAEEEACRVCGCTDDHACEGGCHWVAAGLCSACNDPARIVLGKVRGLVDRSVTPAQLADICDKVLADYQNGTDAQ